METKIILVRESAIQSMIADTFSFLTVIGILTVNYYVWDNSKFLAGIFLILLAIKAISRAQGKIKRCENNEEAIEYLKNN